MAIYSYEVEEAPKEEVDTCSHLVSLYNNSKNWRATDKGNWDGYYKDYRFYRKASEHTMRSNFYVPYIFAIVESVVPKMLNTMFNVSPVVSVIAREGGDTDLAFIIERFLDYAFNEEALELYTTMEDFFKDAAIYGTSFMKILPRFIGEEIPELDFIDADPVDLYKIFPDPRSRSLRKSEWIIHRDWVEYDRLMKQAKQGFYKETVVEQLKRRHDEAWKTDQYKRDRFSEIGKDTDIGYNPQRKTVEILEYWDRDEIISVAGRDVLLKKEKNPFGGMLPFIMTRYTAVPHEFYGIGIPEMAQSLQEELNDLRNQRMDNVNIIINRMFIANRYGDVELDSLASYPGNVILAGDVDDVKPLVTPDVTKSCYLEEERLVSDIQNVTGEWDIGRGAEPEHRTTATGIIRLQQAANVRFDSIVKRIEFGTLRQLAKMFVWFAWHFLPPDKLRMIVGEKDFDKRRGMRFYEMSAHEVLRNYHFQPMGSSTSAIKELRAQQLINLFGIFNGDPMIKQDELRRMLMQALDVKNIDKLLKSEQEMLVEQGQQAAGGLPTGGTTMAVPPIPAQAAPAAGMPIEGTPAVTAPAPMVPVMGAAGPEGPLMGGVPIGIAPAPIPLEM